MLFKISEGELRELPECFRGGEVIIDGVELQNMLLLKLNARHCSALLTKVFVDSCNKLFIPLMRKIFGKAH